jgi:glycosyltransferase involved in cell wall biosynthesis
MIPETKVTIAIPTYNRSELLKTSLQSALAQDYSDFQVLVLDNASTDDTEAVVRSQAIRESLISATKRISEFFAIGSGPLR